MKRKVLGLLIVTLAMVALFGCGKKDKEKKHDFEVSKLASEINDNIRFDEITESPAGSKVLAVKYEIDESEIINCAVYNSSSTAEEIAVIETKDEKSADAVLEAAKKHIETQKALYESYAPDEVARLDKAIVKKLSKYVVVCVTSDTDKANEIIDKY